MADVGNNDPPDELQENFDNNLEGSDNNQSEGFIGMTDDNVNDSQVIEAGMNEVESGLTDPVPVADQPDEVYPGNEARDIIDRAADDNNVDDIERTLEILDQTNTDDRNETVDEIEQTLEMFETDEPTNFETQQLDVGSSDVVVGGLCRTEANEGANDDVQMSFEEEEMANQSLNQLDEGSEQNNPIQDTIEIDDENEDENQCTETNEDVDENNEDREDQMEDQDENNEEIDDPEESAATIPETEDQEDNNTCGQTQEDDIDDNEDSGENVLRDENNVDTEPMEIPDDDNEQEGSSELVSEEKKHDEDHNDVEGI